MNVTTVQLVLQPNTQLAHEFNELITHSINKASVETISEDCLTDDTTKETNYIIKFQENTDAKRFLFKFFDAFDMPDHEFTLVNKSDFSVICYDQDMINFVNALLNESTNKDVALLDMICSELAHSLTESERKVDALESYIDSSGIIYYQQFMKELIEVLDAKELLDKDSILAKMFETIH
jgi:hypothetical protein